MYDLISFVKRGKTRKEILSSLSSPKTPTELSELTNTQRSTVSRTLITLEKRGLVECLTPNEKMGRLYKITPLGERVLKEV